MSDITDVAPDQQAGLPWPESSASFWHSEPNAFLLGHHTTPDLPPAADVVIVGSGITGASAARFLSEDERAKDLSVVMLEAREVCWGATGRNGGHCQPLVYDSNHHVAAFEVKNVAAVGDYIEKHSVPCEWRLGSACRAFFRDDLLDQAAKSIESLRREAPELGQKVTGPLGRNDHDAKKRNRIAGQAVGIVNTEGAAQLWPYKFVTFIVEQLVKAGKLNLQTSTPVTHLETSAFSTDGDGDVGNGSPHSNARVRLTTPRGTITARHVILATNGYTSRLLPEFVDLITAVRCEMSALLPPEGSTRLKTSYGFVGAKGQPDHYDDYLIQRPFYYIDDKGDKTEVVDPEDTGSDVSRGRRIGGHLMFGGGRGFARHPTVGQWQDNIVDEGEAAYLRRALLDNMALDGNTKSLTELTASHQWTGIKGFSRDQMPWVGNVPGRDGTWLCGGYSGHGMPNATLCARAVVDMLLSSDAAPSASDAPFLLQSAQQKLVSDADLPEAYLLTPERMARAREVFPSVYIADGMDRGVGSMESQAEAREKGKQLERANGAGGEAQPRKHHRTESIEQRIVREENEALAGRRWSRKELTEGAGERERNRGCVLM